MKRKMAEESEKVKADSPRSMPLAGRASRTCRRREREREREREQERERPQGEENEDNGGFCFDTP